ncbi:MAG: ThuA domain-containing protein [Bryobacteraceae bacterium]
MRTIFLGLAVLLGVLATGSSSFAAERPLRALILASDRPAAELMRKILTENGKFDVTVNETSAGATGQLFMPYDLVVLNNGLSDSQALHQYVNHGKGFLVVGRGAVNTWLERGQNAPSRSRNLFDVHLSKDPLAAGLPASFTATDDLVYGIKPGKDAEIIATAGNQDPVAWKSTSGKGRVFCLTLGNDLAAMYGEGFADLFLRGALWSASGKAGPVARVDLFRTKTNPVRVLVITGGHAYPTSFYTLFEGYDDIMWAHSTSMLEALKSDLRSHYDMLVLYDWYREMLPDPERKNLLDFLESGRGVLILHHAISDFNVWDWWQREVQGAKYFFKAEGADPASSYKHDLDLHLIPTEEHPITRGIGPFRLVDEVYYGMRYSPQIHVLVKMASPLKDSPVVWIGPYSKARVVYMLPGHDERAHLHPVYRTLVHNAILWINHRLD